jgi:phosphatidylserine/phosphatidylglycerophosphate/cardiolipin synthase-like enzyme
MRARADGDNGISVQAIAGLYVVLLGINATKEAKNGLLGFAIERYDHEKGQWHWLQGMRIFQYIKDEIERGALVGSNICPIQDFVWGDYIAEADHKYTYKVYPCYGEPNKMDMSTFVEVEVTTESSIAGRHAIFFNRGVAGSQGYTRKFGDVRPDKVPRRAAFKWLSRGLEEALRAFINQAADETYGLRAAVYEFQNSDILDEFKKALDRGVDVEIVYDYIKATDTSGHPGSKNLDALKKAGLNKKSVSKPRTRMLSSISHNKFIVLLKDNEPIEVWTGSTNITNGGIFGHANVGHLVRDPEVAQKYLNYWNELHDDPEFTEMRPWNEEETPLPKDGPIKGDVTPIFSPRTSLDALNFYAEAFEQAKTGAFITAAFGLPTQFRALLGKDKPYLRYVLLEKYDEGIGLAAIKNRDVQVAIGRHLGPSQLEQWLDEQLTGLNVHVKYIHTKFMIVDPLTDDPLVITGSANFSAASTQKNDENMLVIRGDKRVADIYLGEFMRLFDHFQWRGITPPKKIRSHPITANERYLKPDDSWTKWFYISESVRAKRREYFCPSRSL